MNTRARIVVSLTVALAACDNSPAEGKTVASVQEAVAKPATATPEGATRYAFSQADSKIKFVGAKVTGKHDGSFESFHGIVAVPGSDFTQGSVTVEIEVASLTADNDKLTEHLKSPDLLDATQFPKARFTSTTVARADGADTYRVTGNLELHGVTKSIGFPATIKLAGGHPEVDAEFAINRKDFGVVYPGKPDDLIKDDVLLKLEIHAAAKP